jgi:hypothetical protein
MRDLPNFRGISHAFGIRSRLFTDVVLMQDSEQQAAKRRQTAPAVNGVVLPTAA